MLDLCPLLPVTAHWQSPCPATQTAGMSALDWGGAGAVVLAAVVEGGRTLSKSEPNSQLFFQGRGFFVSTLALGNCGEGIPLALQRGSLCLGTQPHPKGSPLL